MNLLDFKELLTESVEFLKTIDRIYPNKIDEKLISWIESFQHNWHLEDLHNKFKARVDK